jgi:hypothetical protein
MARVSLSKRSIVAAQPDRRVAALPAATGADVLRAQVCEALASEDWARDDGRIGKVVDELGRLARDAGTIQARMLDCGRRLLRLQDLAGEGGYKALHEAKLVPFSESMASKLRIVAAAVDAGRIPEASLPRAIEAAAIVARLPEEKAARLLEAGQVRPEATARELREAAAAPQMVERMDGPPGPTERRQLERLRDRLRARLAEIEARLARVEHRHSSDTSSAGAVSVQ